ncbi:cell envelope biogenesis protein TolA [Bartonella sp. DGB2]|uniref:cell envelope biogenesis protein TolA n=1 Tax=Bartonella sp. DGB2 TaxID=3388426 RepID=UPI00399012B5
MRVGLTISLLAHGAILTWGLWQLKTPAPFESDLIEAVAISLKVADDKTQLEKGESKAIETHRPPAQKPTKSIPQKPDAIQIGEETKDTKLPLQAKEKPRPIDSAPQKSGNPINEDDVPSIKPRQTPPPAPPLKPEKPIEAAALAKEIKTNTVKDTQTFPSVEPAISNAPAIAQKPDSNPNSPELTNIPLPHNKPKPPQPAPVAPSQKGEKTVDEILTDIPPPLINRNRTQGGGAARSQAKASLGANKSLNNEKKIAQSLVNSVGRCIQKKLKLVAIGGNLQNPPVVNLQFHLNEAGLLEGEPHVTPVRGDSVLLDIMIAQVYAAVYACQPYTDLPKEYYYLWRQGFDFNIDPLKDLSP